MKLFGFNKKSKKPSFLISDPERAWVEDNFIWLIRQFGKPPLQAEQILLTQEFFPQTFRANQVEAENVIQDLAKILELDERKITVEFQQDLRDMVEVPYELIGSALESNCEIVLDTYTILIANFVSKHPKRLICRLIYECIYIKLKESKTQFDTEDDTTAFIYLAGIYFGFGGILFQNLTDTGISNVGGWEEKWNFRADISYTGMAFSLATYSKLIEKDLPEWKDGLPNELKQLYEDAMYYLEEHPRDIFPKQESEAIKLVDLSYKEYAKNEFLKANDMLKNALLLANDPMLKVEIYNNLGYNFLRLESYEESIPYFQHALEIDAQYAYANDNLGYAYIRVGELEKGKHYLDQAILSKNNNNGYTLRNLALYFSAKGDLVAAEDCFKKALNSPDGQVDLLELHYSEFLRLNNREEESIAYLKKAVKKGEPEAIKRASEN